ncbi:hypothetical protein EDD21DRAFT_377813 [Dissophora ornata]|nr:hypothetical protein EDD21DRAFT_377813 [Dissophora ornata]
MVWTGTAVQLANALLQMQLHLLGPASALVQYPSPCFLHAVFPMPTWLAPLATMSTVLHFEVIDLDAHCSMLTTVLRGRKNDELSLKFYVHVLRFRTRYSPGLPFSFSFLPCFPCFPAPMHRRMAREKHRGDAGADTVESLASITGTTKGKGLERDQVDMWGGFQRTDYAFSSQIAHQCLSWTDKPRQSTASNPRGEALSRESTHASKHCTSALVETGYPSQVHASKREHLLLALCYR